jgi:cytochrome d ubiquinol oxidase subunit II
VELNDAVVAVMWLGLTMYAVFGGADFGGGFWDLIAGGPERGAGQRRLIEKVIGPVWEANHVWLIFVLVVLWTGFPEAFAEIMAILFIPLTIAAVGIILRGSGFAFRKESTTLQSQRAFGAVFASSSVLTPFCFGTVAGAVASGRVHQGAHVVDVWLNPTSLLGGTLAVITCAFLAATFLCRDAERVGDAALVRAFRTRALASGALAGAVALGGIAVLRDDAPELYHGLSHDAAAFVVVSGLAGVAALALVATHRFGVARMAAALAVVAVLWGWGRAQYPYMIVDDLTIDQAAGARSTMIAMLVSLAVGAVLLAPSLWWLLRLSRPDDHPPAPVPSTAAGTQEEAA